MSGRQRAGLIFFILGWTTFLALAFGHPTIDVQVMHIVILLIVCVIGMGVFVSD